MFKMKSLLFLVIILISVIAPLASTNVCYANSAEPPSILIIVPNAPTDLEIVLVPENIKALRTDKTFESYFTFYRYNLNQSSEYTVRVSTGGRAFEITLDTPLKSYNNIFTLNLSSQTLTPGKSLSRLIALTSLRISLTLVIEAIVFFLFGYRSRRSWITFLVVNLVTQGFVNIWFLGNVNPLESYIILSLILVEILVFIVELVAFTILVREHGRLRTSLFVMTANLLSLILGGYLITVLPV